MGADWIKMRTDLYRDPKVILIADELISRDSDLSRYVSQNNQCDMSVTRNVMRNAVVGALVTVWGVMRHQGSRDGDDLRLPGCTEAVIDDIAELQGFGSAMLNAGWLIEDAEGLFFPMFFTENNTDPKEDAKAKNAERQKRFRESQRVRSNVTHNVTSNANSNARVEREREKSIKETQGTPIASSVPQVVQVNAVDAAPAKAQPRRTTAFVKPTVSDIVAYVLEVNATVDAKVFWDYYESNGWRVGRNPMKDWKATVRQWQNRNNQGGIYSNGRQSPRLTAAQAREQANADAFAAFDAAAAAQSGRDAAGDWGGSDTALLT
jgi:hypothetical protein